MVELFTTTFCRNVCPVFRMTMLLVGPPKKLGCTPEMPALSISETWMSFRLVKLNSD